MSEHAHGLSAHEIERIINAHVRVRVEYPSELTIVTILGKDTAASLIAAALSRSSGQNLADAHSKSPDIASQSERIAVLEAENAKLKDLTGWAYDTLTEINVSNYDHDDVCGLNAASVEVILGLATVAEPRLCNADHALPAALAPLGEE